MNRDNLVVVVEVNDYHLELFPFWQMYLNYFEKQYIFFYPKELHKKKELGEIIGGTPGGLFRTLVKDNRLQSTIANNRK